MKNDNQPLVSVPVITYNSSKYVIETLESIKFQTYQNLELIVSDDCSTDNTVELCRNWIEKNKGRFVRTELLTVEKNTGVSENCNRSEAACRGEWVKGIAGDDLLVPECVEICVDYVREHPDVEFLFSKIEAFGPNASVVWQYNHGDVFDYSFFSLSTEKQWEAFVLKDCHIPAPTLFSKNGAMEKYGVKNDERIPYTEDEPKWINLLKAGAHFDFMDKVTVHYRVGHPEALSSYNTVLSPVKFETICKLYFYYKFGERYKRNQEETIEETIKIICGYYAEAYKSDTNNIRNSKAYRIGNFLLKPIKLLKKYLNF